MSGDETGFVRADRLPRTGLLAGAGARDDPGASQLVVTPELSIGEARDVWNRGLAFKGTILEDSVCYDLIAGRKEMNRTGATRLALAFGLSIEQREVTEGRVENADDNTFDYRFVARVRVSKGARFADGIASCRISEIAEWTNEKGTKGTPDYKPPQRVPYSQREHFALTKASTRATKRAIADILGGTEAEGGYAP